MIAAQLPVIAIFLAVHIFAGKLRFLNGIPRSRWLSFAGGISVAYVFIHLLPELAEAQEAIGRLQGWLSWLEHHVYLMALLGLSVFYGLERMVKLARKDPQRHPQENGETTTGLGIFALHIGSFTLYNLLIGYLLVHREEQDLRGLFVYALAMSLHFLVNDFGLRQDHRDTYRRLGRWILCMGVLLGWLLGLATQVHEAAVNLLFAFLGGGVILNVLKEELPEERRSRFLPFVLGAIAYALLLVAI